LAPFRLPEALRRLIGSAGEAAASSGGAAAAPAVSTTVVSAGERVAAAAVAIAMATTVSVGAVTTLRDRAGKDAEPIKHRERERVVVASPPAPAEAAPKIVAAQPMRERSRERDARQRDQKEAKTTTTDPVVEGSDTTTTTTTTDPVVEGSDTTTTTAPAPPPEAPPWGMQFSLMGKTASLSLDEDTSKVSGTAGESILFSQTASGDLGSSNPITVQARYWGTAEGQDGTANLWLFLDTAHGRYWYEGSGTLEEIKTPDDGTTGYVFSGSYTLKEWPALDDSRLGKKLAHDGSFDLTLGFWQDQLTLYTVDLDLVSGALSAALTTG
jgi:hypothetical protein